MKDNAEKECIVIADLNYYDYDMMNRVYSIEGICPTIRTPTGGGNFTKILVRKC